MYVNQCCLHKTNFQIDSNRMQNVGETNITGKEETQKFLNRLETTTHNCLAKNKHTTDFWLKNSLIHQFHFLSTSV